MKAFVLAGKAIFTVSNAKGDHYTFQVTRKETEGRPVTFFVALLTGPNNETDYTYMGVLSQAVGTVILTKASKFNPESLPVKVAQWALALLWRNQPVPAGYAIQHEGRCGRCGRTLTVPESIQTGLGPECAAKMGLGPVAPAPVPADLFEENRLPQGGYVNRDNADVVGVQ